MSNPAENQEQSIGRQPPDVKQNTLAASTEPIKRSCKCQPVAKGSEERRLVVAIDGTSNQFGDKNTNVIELYARIVKSANQLTYYNSGIGTYVKPNRLFSSWRSTVASLLEMAFAWNFNSTVLAAYRWLSENYKDGDQIFLFGFSRGAYQVRVLAGMIETVGLIFAGNHEQIPYAYEVYKDSTPYDEPDKDQIKRKQSSRETDQSNQTSASAGGQPGEANRPNTSNAQNESSDTAARFKRTFSRPDVNIHFMGVWDTVSAVGFFKEKDLRFTQSCNHICYFRHALALDECRVKFIPEGINTPHAKTIQNYLRESQKVVSNLARDTDQNVGDAQTPGSKDHSFDNQQGIFNLAGKPGVIRDDGKGKAGTSNKDHKKGKPLEIKEVWFAGSHSDIGGGLKINQTLNLDDVPALWMANEAQTAGLDLQASNVEWNWEALETDKPTLSMKWYWWILEYFFIPRLSRKRIDTTWVPNQGRGRVIHPGQKIHASVAFKKDYIPKATFSNDWKDQKPDWNDIIGKGKKDNTGWAKNLGDILELDLFDLSNVDSLVAQLKKNNNSETDVRPALRRLSFITLVDGGRDAIVNTKDATSSLSNVLKTTDIDLQLESAIILRRIADYVSQTDLWQQEIIPALCHVLKTSDHPALLGKAVAILARGFEFPAAMVEFREKLPALITGLFSSKNKVDGLYALELVSGNDTALQAVIHSEFLSKIVVSLKEFLTIENRGILSYTARILSRMAHYPEVQAGIDIPDILNFIKKLLKSRILADEGIYLLSRLVNDRHLRAEIVKNDDIVFSLIKLALSDSGSFLFFPSLHSSALQTLSKLVQYDDVSNIQAATCDSRAFKLISETLEKSINEGDETIEDYEDGDEDYEDDEDNEYDGIQSAFGVLSVLAKNDTTRNEIIQSCVMGVLKTLLRSKRPLLLKRATKGLISLATQHDFQDALFTPEVIQSVQQTDGGDRLLPRLSLRTLLLRKRPLLLRRASKGLTCSVIQRDFQATLFTPEVIHSVQQTDGEDGLLPRLRRRLITKADYDNRESVDDSVEIHG